MIRVALTVTPKVQKGELFGTTLYVSALAGLTGKPPLPHQRLPVGVGIFPSLGRCLAIVINSTVKIRDLVHVSLLVPPVSWVTTSSGTWDSKGRLVRVYIPKDTVTVPRDVPHAYVRQWHERNTVDHVTEEQDLRSWTRPKQDRAVEAVAKRYLLTLLLVPLEDKS